MGARDPEVEKMMIVLYCCRAWPILVNAGVGHCGLCGERPRL